MTTTEKLQLLAADLTREFPRSPRVVLGGFVIAARCLDKCRAVVAGTAGEYHSGCPLDLMLLDFAGIPYDDFKAFVATGATDAEAGAWLAKTAKPSRLEIIRWNNKMRDLRLSELPDQLQEYMEEYIPQNVPRNRPVYHFFDVYDLEEERL